MNDTNDKTLALSPSPAPVAAPASAPPSGKPRINAKDLPHHNAGKPTAPPPAPAQQSLVVGAEREAPEAVCPRLLTILSWRRSHDTYSEKAFNEWLVAKVNEIGVKHKVQVSRRTSYRIVVARVPRADGSFSDALFSSHVDTQDHKPLPAKVAGDPDHAVMQPLVYDSNFGHIMLDTKSDKSGGCLGADDGIGVWIMLAMIEAGVAGTYVFHRAEEVGGHAAQAMSHVEKEFLKEHTMAVAFDRPRYNEVIIHQGGSICASAKFGQALAKALNDADPDGIFEFETSTRGVFTDTKVYRGIIPECVNIGVGYEHQHTQKEFQDYAHALALRDACIKLNWDALPIDRDPSTVANEWNGSNRGRYNGGMWSDDRDMGNTWGNPNWPKNTYGGGTSGGAATRGKSSAPAPKPLATVPLMTAREELEQMTLDDVRAYVIESPEDASVMIAELLVDLGAAEKRNETMRALLGLT